MQQLKALIQETIFEALTEELCAKGKAYIKARKAAGEKSSAYLSGRAVKVCKGLMKSEEIDPSEASNYKGSIDTIIKGKRNVGQIALGKNANIKYVNDFIKWIEDHSLKTIKVPSNPHNAYIIFNPQARAEAEELKDIAEKYNGYLSAEATDEDTRRIGQILGYKKEAVEAFIKKQKENKIESINILTESLRNWFEKEDWVRIDTQGNITGPCGTMKKGKATTRCLPRAKANRLTKAQRASTARKKVAGSKKGKQFVPNTKKAKVKLRKK
jgi:hypothetical protein